jgi:hypothetical protein
MTPPSPKAADTLFRTKASVRGRVNRQIAITFTPACVANRYMINRDQYAAMVCTCDRLYMFC